MPEAMTISIEAAGTETHRALETTLRAWNEAMSGPANRGEFMIVLRDAAGRACGGIMARLYRDGLWIDLVYLDDVLRGQGRGTALMQAAEAEGIRLGARFAYLDTMSWQARPFYETLGYRVFGQVAYEGGRFTRYFMHKDLTP